MRFTYLLSDGERYIGSRYKYYNLFRMAFDTERWTEKHYKPHGRIPVLFGDKSRRYAQVKEPYVLIENDIATLRGMGKYARIEGERIRRALAVIVTSEDHAEYLITRYGIKPLVIHLRPLEQDLDFEPFSKLPGRNLVYSGGLFSWSDRRSHYGYRSYYEIFKAFIEAGWTVTIYTPGAKKEHIRREYESIGCTLHSRHPQDDLYREMSQYTAGFQGYNKTDVPAEVYDYAMKCRPNKLWEYLAAGIPTIGYQGGNGMELYKDNWGIVLNSLDDITDDFDLPGFWGYRDAEVIDKDIDRLREYMEGVK